MTHITTPRFGRLIAATALFSVMCNLLMLTGPLFMLQVYDRVLTSRSEETLLALFALVALLYALFAAFEFARGRIIAFVGVQTQTMLRGRVFTAMMTGAHKSSPATLTDLETIRSFCASPIVLALFDLPWTPLFISVLFAFHPALGWVAVAGGGVLICVALLNQALTARSIKDSADLNRSANTLALGSLAQKDVVNSNGMQDAILSRYAGLQDGSIRVAMRATTLTSSFAAFSKGFRLFLQSAVLAVGAWFVLQQQLTAGAMIACSILMGRAFAPVDAIIGQWGFLQQARSAWGALRPLLEQQSTNGRPTQLPAPDAQLSVRAISLLSPDASRPLLRNVSFDVTPGQAVGIIGRSGAGKSTLARVLTGLQTPAAGEVRLGGATLNQYETGALGRYVGYVAQDAQLFSATVSENIAHMLTQPDAARVVRAAQRAGVHEAVLSLPNGYDTTIGEGALHLAGGLKQGLCLARALYHDPALLILDEPAAALDADGMAALHEAIQTMKAAGKAVVIMTHRPSSVTDCDQIIVLEQGRVKAGGLRDTILSDQADTVPVSAPTPNERKSA